MNRFNKQHRPPPHLDVYLTGVPTSIGGKELKNRLANQFGWIKFVETFEAWLNHLTGNIVIDFSTYDGSGAFMTAVINGRINFLDRAGIQHIGIVGARHFFEMIHRNTDIDLLYYDGKPNSHWIRSRRPNRPSDGKPYDRPPPRGNPLGTSSNMVPVAGVNRAIPPRNMNQFSGVKGGSGANVRPKPMRVGCGRQRDRNSPSDEDDEMVGPFPTSSAVSASLRRLINFSIWKSTATGKAHILQFCSPNKQIDGQPRTEPNSSPLPKMIYGKRRSRTPLPFSQRKAIVGDNNFTPRRLSASVHRHPQCSISPSPPQFCQHRPSISFFHQQLKAQQFSNKNSHLNNYNFQWSQGRSPERSGDNGAIASRIEPASMVVGLDSTKERMRQTRRRHHRFLRTPSPQLLFGSNNNKKDGQIQGPHTVQTRTRHPHFYQHPNPQQQPQPFSMAAFSSGTTSPGHSSSSITHGGHLFIPKRKGGRVQFRRNNLCKSDYDMFWPKQRRGVGNLKRQMKKVEPDIILTDDDSPAEGRSSGIGRGSFFSTTSSMNKSTKNATGKHSATTQKVHRNPNELEEDELTNETDDEGIDDGIVGGEEPMQIDVDDQKGKMEGKAAGEDEEKPKETEEEEEFNIDEYEAPFEFVEDDDEVQQQQEQQPQEENNDNPQEKGEKEANDNRSDDNEQIDSPQSNNFGGGNIDDILEGESMEDLNEIDENALLNETDDERQQQREEEEEGDQRPAQQSSSSSLEQSAQNSQIDDNDEILMFQVRHISIDKGNGQNATGRGGGGPIGIGRKGQRIQLVKSEIMEREEMGGDGSSDKPLLLL